MEATLRLREILASKPRLSLRHFDVVRRIGRRGTVLVPGQESKGSQEVEAVATAPPPAPHVKTTSVGGRNDFFGCESIVVAAFLKGHHDLGTFALKVKLTFREQERRITRNFERAAIATSTAGGGGGGGGVSRTVVAERINLIPELSVAPSSLHNPGVAGHSAIESGFQSDNSAGAEATTKHWDGEDCPHVLPVLAYFMDSIANLPTAIGCQKLWSVYGDALARTTVVLVYPHIQFPNLNQVCVCPYDCVRRFVCAR